jgi:hypothetical protein
MITGARRYLVFTGESTTGLAGEDAESPRPGLLVVRCPRCCLAQLLDEIRIDIALLVHHELRATGDDEREEVVEGHD